MVLRLFELSSSKDVFFINWSGGYHSEVWFGEVKSGMPSGRAPVSLG